jgi:hypothetical protein
MRCPHGSLVRRRRGRRQIGLRRRDRLSPRRALQRPPRAAGGRGGAASRTDDPARRRRDHHGRDAGLRAALRRAGARAVVGCVVARTRREGARRDAARATIAPTRRGT